MLITRKRKQSKRSIYRTNLPKEVMGLPDFPFPEQKKSYLKREDILQFLNDYATHFNIRSSIQVRR